MGDDQGDYKATETSLVEPLNYSLASRSSSSPATIPTFDFTSFTTASHQSTWLPSPAPPASRQPLHTSHTEFAPPQTDFVLYDQPGQVPHRPQRAPSAPQPGHPFNAGQHFYANSAPSSTSAFPQPQLQQRPPVPLFSSSSNNVPQNNVAAMADLNSNNSFDSGASLLHGFSSEMSPWEGQVTAFTSINPSVSSGSTRTVSPKDLYLDPQQSAPASTAFTNLTSPDIGDSPYTYDLNDSFDNSPMFQGEPVMPSEHWYPLFPEEESKSAALDLPPVAPVAPALERTVSTNTNKSSASSSNSPVVLPHRRKSSVTDSPATNAGITKARRRKGPLPQIVVDSTDKVAAKRARNTLAARDSRQRKLDHVMNLEKRNAELELEVERWRSIAYAQGYSES
ncbi:hypothetical protein BU26DRAFT_598542 [Trematosphaeria pertusa]|uniref:Uncharacterized protein n=1 Tax=Trematosphaeria pertusa TaxID=390896 RepID=A0A6A6J034_9PLEO|nr:uncharacterized protein BU26DRAFT_598542 [Trematosphaeria pertusa]KAF2255677.1 hypothetical protein BU26DRAFT_598542 [Trematosphaeria pertusa]